MKLTKKFSVKARATSWNPNGANANNLDVLHHLQACNNSASALTVEVADGDMDFTVTVPANDVTVIISSNDGIAIKGALNVTPSAACDFLAVFE